MKHSRLAVLKPREHFSMDADILKTLKQYFDHMALSISAPTGKEVDVSDRTLALLNLARELSNSHTSQSHTEGLFYRRRLILDKT